MFARQILLLMVSVLAVGASQASSLNRATNRATSENLLDQIAGRYSRTAAGEASMNSEDEVIEASKIRQDLAILPIKNSASARVSFYIGSGHGAQASCSGEEIFHVSQDGKSLYSGADLSTEGGSDSMALENFDGACSMTLSKGNEGSVTLRSSSQCQIEMCGAGTGMNQAGARLEFAKTSH